MNARIVPLLHTSLNYICYVYQCSHTFGNCGRCMCEFEVSSKTIVIIISHNPFSDIAIIVVAWSTFTHSQSECKGEIK